MKKQFDFQNKYTTHKYTIPDLPIAFVGPPPAHGPVLSSPAVAADARPQYVKPFPLRQGKYYFLNSMNKFIKRGIVHTPTFLSPSLFLSSAFRIGD